MFLNSLRKRNSDFINSVFQFHREGLLPPNCYVLDLDTIEENAKNIADEAKKYEMKVYSMTKQIGRHPAALKAITNGGIDASVAVDMQCAEAVHKGGHKVGHIGHLVQIAKCDTQKAIDMEPEYWTVFNMEKVEEISKCIHKKSQKVLARIYAEGDTFYHGHEGGFPASEIVEIAKKINGYDNIEFAGITSFPTLLFDNNIKDVYTTPNLETLKIAARLLNQAGFEKIEINTPGTTSSHVLNILAENGSTQVEPGHGLTGTTPLHAVKELPESPAMLYLSEVSHIHEGKPFCYGGGTYIDPVFPKYQVKCLVGNKEDDFLTSLTDIEIMDYNAIDYYAILDPKKGNKVNIGDTVICGFRGQAFVTRAYVAAISGIKSGSPKLEGIVMS